MKKFLCTLLCLAVLPVLSACSKTPEAPLPEPHVSQMRSICELATMECYYHNVAKYKVENAETFLWITKDKHFWIEYSGQVTIGIDASQVSMTIDGDNVQITLPPAEVLGCKVDPNSLNEDSFIIAKNSATVTAEDQTTAFKEAQANMENAAKNDSALLLTAQQRAQALLEDYVQNIGNKLGKQYRVTWVYRNEDTSTAPAGTASSVSSAEA